MRQGKLEGMIGFFLSAVLVCIAVGMLAAIFWAAWLANKAFWTWAWFGQVPDPLGGILMIWWFVVVLVMAFLYGAAKLRGDDE